MKAIEWVLAVFLATVLLCMELPAIAAERFVGLKMQSVTTAGGQKLELAIWYPTSIASKQLDLGAYSMNVSMGSAIDSGKFPLVLISHGTGGNLFNHHELATALARNGFVVAALNHPGDYYKDRSMVGKLPYFTERPRQVTRMLDALLADPVWGPAIDAERIGFIGHSAGGFTGAALIGATPSLVQTVRHCANNYSDDPWFCAVSGTREQAQESGRNVQYLPAIASSSDSRIKAAVLIAPVGAFFPEENLRNIRVPVRVYLAEKDEILVPRFHAGYVAQTIPGAESVRVNGAGHFMLASKLNLKVAVDGAEVNADPAGFDRASMIARVSAELPAWFAKRLAR